MVRLIMGVKGSGKTKQLIELINNAAKDEPGNVVCIEANRTMTYDIHYHIRLIDAQEYNLDSYELFRGFISGLYAGNYDISHVFIDNLCKTIGREVDKDTENFLNWLDAFGEKNNIKFTVPPRPAPPRPPEGVQTPLKARRPFPYPQPPPLPAGRGGVFQVSVLRLGGSGVRTRRPAPPADCNSRSLPRRTGR